MAIALAPSTKVDRADLQLVFARSLIQVGRKWPRHFSDKMEGAGQTYARWRTLFWISQSPDGVSQRKLAESLGVEEPTLVRLLDALQKQGLVERRPHKTDRRVNLVFNTPAAEPVLASGNQLAASMRDQMFDGVSSEDIAAGIRVLEMIARRLDRT